MTEEAEVQVWNPKTREERDRVCDMTNPLMLRVYGKQIKPGWLELYETAVLMYIASQHYPVAAALMENMGDGKWRTRFEAVDTKHQGKGYGRMLFCEIERTVKEEERSVGDAPPVIKLFSFVDKENMDTHGEFMKKLGFKPMSEDEVEDEDIECDDHEVAFCKELI